MFLEFRSFCWSVFLLALSATPALAQSRSQIADSLRKVVADHRSRLHLADSMGDHASAVSIRLELAPLVKPKEATALLRDAVAMARSSDPATEIMVRTRLAEHYARMGNHRLAYAEAWEIVALGNEALSVQAEESGSRADRERANALAERDSLRQVWNEELADAKAFVREAEERSRNWMSVAIGVTVVFLLSIVVLVYRSGRSGRRIRAELVALRSEITALKERGPTDQVRLTTAPVLPVTDPVVAPASTPRPSTTTELDPVVWAMFRKMGPERLATLRDARARGDHDKVTRVVHSLKPQLVNFDKDLFTDLCARITAPEASTNTMRWTADLDALEKGIAEVLLRTGH